jgi:D-arginine dehydrogenase
MPPSETHATTADVLIIGGGMAGVSLAAALAPDRRVILLEAEAQPGYHATGRSAAVFVPNYGSPLIRALSALARPTFDEPDPAYFNDHLLTRRGLLRVVKPDGEAIYRHAMGGAEGIQPVSVSEAARLFPPLNPGRFVAASYEADVHDIDVDALLQGYLRQARAAGVQILFEQKVQHVDRVHGAWQVATMDEDYEAPVLVNAAGAWADHIAGFVGLAPIGIRACRRSVAMLPMPDLPSAGSCWPMTVPFPTGWYAKSEAGGLLVSAAEEDELEPQDVMVDDLTLAEGMHRFAQDTKVTITRLERSWAGLRSFAPDGRPVLGFDPLAEGFFWLAGQGGAGIQTAPALAQLGAALIAGERPHPELVGQIDIRRLR